MYFIPPPPGVRTSPMAYAARLASCEISAHLGRHDPKPNEGRRAQLPSLDDAFFGDRIAETAHGGSSSPPRPMYMQAPAQPAGSPRISAVNPLLNRIESGHRQQHASGIGHTDLVQSRLVKAAAQLHRVEANPGLQAVDANRAQRVRFSRTNLECERMDNTRSTRAPQPREQLGRFLLRFDDNKWGANTPPVSPVARTRPLERTEQGDDTDDSDTETYNFRGWKCTYPTRPSVRPPAHSGTPSNLRMSPCLSRRLSSRTPDADDTSISLPPVHP